MTGGPQEQVTDGNEFFGVGIEPASTAVIGSQEVPWIYEDRISKEDFLETMINFYHFNKSERTECGTKGRQHVLKNYGFDSFCKQWVDIFDNVVAKHGSWQNRKSYKSWVLKEII